MAIIQRYVWKNILQQQMEELLEIIFRYKIECSIV